MKYFSDPIMHDCVMCGRDTFIQASSIKGALSGLHMEDEDEIGGVKGWECSNDADFPFDSSCDAIVCRKCIGEERMSVGVYPLSIINQILNGEMKKSKKK